MATPEEQNEKRLQLAFETAYRLDQLEKQVAKIDKTLFVSNGVPSFKDDLRDIKTWVNAQKDKEEKAKGWADIVVTTVIKWAIPLLMGYLIANTQFNFPGI